MKYFLSFRNLVAGLYQVFVWRKQCIRMLVFRLACCHYWADLIFTRNMVLPTLASMTIKPIWFLLHFLAPACHPPTQAGWVATVPRLAPFLSLSRLCPPWWGLQWAPTGRGWPSSANEMKCISLSVCCPVFSVMSPEVRNCPLPSQLPVLLTCILFPPALLLQRLAESEKTGRDFARNIYMPPIGWNLVI